MMKDEEEKNVICIQLINFFPVNIFSSLLSAQLIRRTILPAAVHDTVVMLPLSW